MANVATLGARAEFDVSAFRSGTAQMLQGINSIKQAIKGVNVDQQNFQQTTNKTSSSLGSLSSYFTKGIAAGTGFGAAMMAVSKAGEILSFTLQKLTDGLKWGAELAMQAEQSQIAFEVMLKSADKAKKTMRDIEGFALATPFDTAGLTDNVMLLKGMGIATEDLLPAMKTLGDMSLGNNEKLKGLSLAFGQVQAKGKLMAQEFNQFAERGINLRQAVANEMQIPVEKFSKAMEDGKVTADIFRNALIELSRTEFGGMMEKQNDTVLGKLNKMQEQIGQTFKKVAIDLYDFFGGAKAIDAASGFLDYITDDYVPAALELFKGMATTIANIFDSIIRDIGKKIKLFGDSLQFAAKDSPLYRMMGADVSGFAKKIQGIGEKLSTPTPFRDRLNSMVEGFAQRGKGSNAELEGMQKKLIGKGFGDITQLFEAGISQARTKLKDSIGWYSGLQMGLRNLRGGLVDAGNMIDGIKSPAQVALNAKTGALEAGSSEAMSMIIKQLTSGKVESDRKKTLDATKAIAKATTKLATKLVDEGLQLLGVVEKF